MKAGSVPSCACRKYAQADLDQLCLQGSQLSVQLLLIAWTLCVDRDAGQLHLQAWVVASF